MSEELATEKKQPLKRPQQPGKEPAKARPAAPDGGAAAVIHLQQQAGNRAVQRLLAQRQGTEGFELDDATAGRINRARGGGQPLDGAVQEQMGALLGYSFQGVQVHDDAESDELNGQLHSRAFTIDRDIFFRRGEHNPSSSSGRELIAHELSHVVQQGTGRVSGAGRLAVRPAGDAFEQEADARASQVASGAYDAGGQGAAGGIQRRGEIPEEEEESPVQGKALQRQGAIPEEEEESPVQGKALQRQGAIPEEEEESPVQGKALQRQEGATEGEEG